MPRSPNISYYHYSSEELDADNNVIDIRFYMTLRELESKFNKSRTTFHRVMVDPNRKVKSLPNFRFKKVTCQFTGGSSMMSSPQRWWPK